jgi:hypothetical protein
MGVLALGLIWFGIASLALVLWRGYQLAIFKQFATFYFYVFGDLVGSLLVLLSYGKNAEYVRWYWIMNFVTLFLGCTILGEMLARMWLPVEALRRAARISQIALGALIAGSLGRFVAIELRTPLNSSAFRQLERDCRAGQAIFFIAILLVVFYYGIPVGKNLKTICLGYGLYIWVSLLSLAVWLYAGHHVAVACAYLQPASFDAATAIWLVGLWNPAEPAAVFAMHTEQTSESDGGSSDLRVRLRSVTGRLGPKAARA